MSSSPSKAAIEAPLTISTLLNSLHTHLQTQTQLLPTLHAQLGLPQSALTDELSALRERLASCVEQQIDLRRQEVSEWMRKCEEVEQACTRYNKALGGHVKAIGASLGELRKQNVLPVRHEMLSKYQDKLDQLYKTKLEQLTNLTNRVASLSKTLGFDYFALDIIEPVPAPGEDVTDILSLRDVTPERFSKLEKELVRGKGEITRRLQHLSTTLMHLDWLYHELDMTPPSYDETLTITPSSSSIVPPAPSNGFSASIGPSDPFMSSVSAFSTPTPLSKTSQHSANTLFSEGPTVNGYHRIFALFVARIDEAESEGKSVEPGSLIGVEGVEPTSGLLNWAEQTKAELEDIKKRRETHIQAMYDQLESLWKRLGVDDADIDGFVDNNRGSTEEVVRAYESELERMLELKRERMSVFIGNARAEIEALWNDLMICGEERADFAPFADDEHTEELLIIHEEEIRRLKEERRLKAPLLTSIRKYFEICEEEKELTAAAMDQSRLLGRGPRDPGRLLREEKMRKRVSREKPRLEQELLLSIPAWEEEHGKPFLVNGISMIEFLMETVSVADKENQRKNKSRAGSVPPRATTPSGPSHGLRPPRSADSTTSVRPESSMSNGPNKRAKLISDGSNGRGPGKRQQDSRALPHRVPFGSRAGALNATSYDADSAFVTIHKANKTPGANSSLPRPVSGSKLQYAPPMPHLVHGSQSGNYGPGGIGLGYASTSNRIVSASASATTGIYSSMRNTSQQARAQDIPQKLQPKRSARNSRRESFRPRQSADGGPSWAPAESVSSRYGTFASQVVKEEDEY